MEIIAACLGQSDLDPPGKSAMFYTWRYNFKQQSFWQSMILENKIS